MLQRVFVWGKIIDCNEGKMTKKPLIIIGIIILLFGFGSLPRILSFPVYREGIKLVELIEKYKIAYGTYPVSLEQLGQKIKYDDKGWRGIRYAAYEEGNEFGLTCYGLWALREVYSSKTKEWKALN
jgi:hypothetical protein